MADWNGSYGQVDLDKSQDNWYPIMEREWTGKNGLDWREARLDAVFLLVYHFSYFLTVFNYCNQSIISGMFVLKGKALLLSIKRQYSFHFHTYKTVEKKEC